MIQFLFAFHGWGLLVLRVILGVIMIKHGLPKLRHLEGTSESFHGMGFRPARFWALVAGAVEVFGGLLLLAGFFTQIAAFVIAVQFLVVIVFVNLRDGFSEWEYDLLILGSALMLVVSGAGMYSVDEMFRFILY
jgi:putative oxidoreductase